MMISDEMPDFSILINEMLEKCTQRGLSAKFAQESGVFLGTLFDFLRNEAEAGEISSEVTGALMCSQALHELFRQEDWASVIQYGELLVGTLSESAVSGNAREVVLSAKSSILAQLTNAARRIGKTQDALRFADLACAVIDKDTYRRVLALNHRALALQELKRTAEAEVCYCEGIQIISNITAENTRLEELRQVLAINLQTLQAERGESLNDLQDFDVEELKKSDPLAQYDGLFQRPIGIESLRLNHEALELMQRGLHDVALKRLLRVRIATDDLSAEKRGNIESNIATCYAELGQFGNAESAYRLAVRIECNLSPAP